MSPSSLSLSRRYLVKVDQFYSVHDWKSFGGGKLIIGQRSENRRCRKLTQIDFCATHLQFITHSNDSNCKLCVFLLIVWNVQDKIDILLSNIFIKMVVLITSR